MFASRTAIHLRPRGPKPRALKTERRSGEIGALDGTCTHTLPADNGLLFYSATRARWRALQRLVGSAGNAPVRRFQHCLMTPDLQSGCWIHHPLVAGVGIAPT
jgi:hypothetical protein